MKKKFYVHAQDKKGDLLEYLVKHFYNRPLLGHGPEVKDRSSSCFFLLNENVRFSKSNLHYACLQLVIELASKPLDVDLDEFRDLVHEQIGKEIR